MAVIEHRQHVFEGEMRNDGIRPIFTAKYQTSRAKAVEMIESGKFGLEDTDFWILQNRSKSGAVVFSGLIISHSGCLKINDHLSKENRVKCSCFQRSIVESKTFGEMIVYDYVDDDVCEVGEVSAANCRNAYPLSMAYKRCFDRVVLKKSRLAYSGVYSEAEADDFREPVQAVQRQPAKQRAKAPASEPQPQMPSPQLSESMIQRISTPASVSMPSNAKQSAPSARARNGITNAADQVELPVRSSSQPSGMNLRQAMSWKITYGKLAGKTMGEILGYEEGLGTVFLQCFVNNAGHSEEAEAARIMMGALQRKELQFIGTQS
ncbi:MAG: hypothetical protein ACI4WR_08515 [Bulleidia sp.]